MSVADAVIALCLMTLLWVPNPAMSPAPGHQAQQPKPLMQDDFGSAQGELNEIFHTGGTEQNIVRAQASGQPGGALHWLRKTSGYYYVRPTRSVVSGAGRIAVSCRVNFETTNPYWWTFSLTDPTYKTDYLQIFSGLGYEGNKIYGAYGKLMYVNPDGSWRTLCAIKAGWRQVRLVVDLTAGTATIYYDSLQIPVASDVPLLHRPAADSAALKPMFDGFSSQGEGGFWLSDFLIDDLPRAKRAVSSRSRPDDFRLARAGLELQIARTTGAVAGLSMQGRRLFGSGNDRYAFENRERAAFAREQNDHVQTAQMEENRLLLTCTNPDLPGITIHKTYVLEANGEAGKRVEFESAGAEGFLTHRLELSLDPAFAGASAPSGFSFLQGLKPGEYSALRNTPCLITKDLRVGAGMYRYRVNDRFVLPDVTTGGGTQDWECPVFEDYLRPGKPISAEMRFFVFSGDVGSYEQHLVGSTEYRQMFPAQQPAWVDTLVADAMFTSTGILPTIRAAAPLPVSSSIWFLNPPWGNWWSTSDPPARKGAGVSGIAPGFRKNAPNARVSAYANELFDRNSDVYKQHPDFGVTDREGSLTDAGVPSDAGGAPTYYLQIRNPAAREYYIDMYLDRVKNWGLDYLYLDVPGALHESPDWKLNTVVQSYDWIEFYRDLKAKLKRQSSDAAFWTNGFMPYSDVGYLEWLDQPWQEIVSGQNWRYYAFSLWLTKLRQPEGYLIVPTYGRPEAQPGISTYSIAYGWGGHGAASGYLPWQTAALETRGVKLAAGAVEAPWWRTDSATECFGVNNGGNAIINVISHSDEAQARITVNTRALGLEQGGSYLLRILTMNPPDTKEGLRAFALAALRTQRIDGDSMTLTVPVHKGLLTAVVLSKAFAVAEENGARHSETGLIDTYACHLKSVRSNGAQTQYVLTCGVANVSLFFPYGKQASSGSKRVSSASATVNGVSGVRVTLPDAGDYTLTIH